LNILSRLVRERIDRQRERERERERERRRREETSFFIDARR